MSDHTAFVATDICGCTPWVAVMGYGDDADLYREAARQIKAGMSVTQMPVDEWKERGWHCADHPDGPPWWKSRGGKVKRPTSWPAPENVALGL